jgi:peptidoglycan/xylan/chitin deacetylase (PgdA/CDA1 family)
MRAILTYHSIDDSGSAISVSREAFARQIAWLASGRLRVATLPDLLDLPDDGPDAVALTFDDAFENFEGEAWPRLRAFGLPATLFVVTQHAGGSNAWSGRATAGIPTLPLLGWPALARLRDEGVGIGAHSRTHRSLAAIGGDELADEVSRCAEDLQQRLGVRPVAFAYPFGDAPDAAKRLTRETYACACTTEYRPLEASDAREALPRLDMFYFQREGALNAWGRRSFRARLAARRAARALRSAARHAGGMRP